jgi:hypothetical protein
MIRSTLFEALLSMGAQAPLESITARDPRVVS